MNIFNLVQNYQGMFPYMIEKATSFSIFHKFLLIFERSSGASLVAQWLRIRLPLQGTQVRALVQEDPTCRGATKPVRHIY